MLVCLGILFGALFLYKVLINWLISRSMSANQSPTVTVSVMKAEISPWQPSIKVSGSLRAINGVNVTTSLAGLVQYIYFAPGDYVKQGMVLVQLNADAEIGQLQSLQAQLELARITYERDQKQYAIQAVSKQTVDADFQNLRSLQGQVAQQKAIVEKKTLRAPFSGRTGILLVNLGQYLNTGDAVTSLQSLDPIYVDFYVPQQELDRIKNGQNVVVTTDSNSSKKYTGKITTINPAVDTDTRNVQVEATLPNAKYQLIPGMFVDVEVVTGSPITYLTLPQTAVSYNPYGDIVYVVKETGKDDNGKPILTATQTFVVTGEARGDQVQILKGIQAGTTVVTSGQLKLKNGSHVAINNSVVPANSPYTKASNDHNA